ncbi:TRAF-type zinc finger domain-containing protein 1 [Papilio machaon]|uniref:TRAF-type zinc finger domain-containing protein 1 n=1 Tax=Papilio machaon TaxID=76193 RepID=A0A194R1I1_PAPMA|nr:TRAF-type zinc finger domain-containing protein 1 [Papilio machaon]
MDEEIKICENCNREIPVVNYTIHSVHCARNIRMCPVCKEPVPIAELEEHTEKLHKLLPCKQCGEKVRGTDMEDHIRDSCDRTIQSCRWCELELSRRELPLHEGYCGTRTEECEQCGEFIMHKYRQLHLDSNHGFVRLDDDPIPRVNRQRPAASTATASASGSGMTSYQRPADRLSRFLDLPDRPPIVGPELTRLFNTITEANTKIDNLHTARESPRSPDASPNQGSNYDGRNFNQWRQNVNLNLPRNNNAQVNAPGVPGTSNHFKPAPRGAIKKRKAPKPPNPKTPESKPDQSQQHAGRMYSLFPPSTSTSTPNTPISNSIPSATSRPMPGPICGPIRGPKPGPNDPFSGPYNRRNFTPLSPNDNAPGSANTNGRLPEATSSEEQKRREFIKAVPVKLTAQKSEIERNPNEEVNKAEDFRNVKPMSTEEFMKRFRELQLDNSKREENSPRERFSGREENSPRGNVPGRLESSPPERFFRREDSSPDSFFTPTPGDRFNAIKSSLKELRRGLNEVTAPYNNNNNNANERGNASRENPAVAMSGSSNSDSDSDGSEAAGGGKSPRGDEAAGGDLAAGGEEGACALDIINVKLPCEFCGTLIQANDLVQHQVIVGM